MKVFRLDKNAIAAAIKAQPELADGLEALAQRGVWTRLFASSGSVRFGLPASDDEWARFDKSLRAAVQAIDPTRAA